MVRIRSMTVNLYVLHRLDEGYCRHIRHKSLPLVTLLHFVLKFPWSSTTYFCSGAADSLTAEFHACSLQQDCFSTVQSSPGYYVRCELLTIVSTGLNEAPYHHATYHSGQLASFSVFSCSVVRLQRQWGLSAR